MNSVVYIEYRCLKGRTCQDRQESRKASSTRATSDKRDCLESIPSMYNKEDSTAHCMQVRHGSPSLPASLPPQATAPPTTRHVPEQLSKVRPQAERRDPIAKQEYLPDVRPFPTLPVACVLPTSCKPDLNCGGQADRPT